MASALLSFPQQQQAAAGQQQFSPPPIGAGFAWGDGEMQQQQQQQQQHGGAAAVATAATQQQHPQPTTTTTTLSGVAEIARLTREYEAEAACLAEQLELAGIVPRDALSPAARRDLALLAGLASALQLTEARPELVLAAWAALRVREDRALRLQQRLRRGLDDLSRRRQAAGAKLRALRGVLAEVRARQAAAEAGGELQDEARVADAMRDKRLEYERQAARHLKRLVANGFAPDLTHGALLERRAGVEALQARLEALQARLAAFHGLPPTLLGARLRLEAAEAALADKQRRVQARLADMH